MNSKQYNYFTNNEPNFQTIKQWETDPINAEFISEKQEDNSNYTKDFFKNFNIEDIENDTFNALKEDSFTQFIYF